MPFGFFLIASSIVVLWEMFRLNWFCSTRSSSVPEYKYASTPTWFFLDFVMNPHQKHLNSSSRFVLVSLITMSALGFSCLTTSGTISLGSSLLISIVLFPKRSPYNPPV